METTPRWEYWAKRLARESASLVRHGPCSDSDCCATAISNAKAAERLRTALGAFSKSCNVKVKTE